MASIKPKPTRDYDPAVMQNEKEASGTMFADSSGNALFVYGTTVPSDGDSGYAIGCIFVHTDGGVGTTLYANEGSATSCDFDTITVA